MSLDDLAFADVVGLQRLLTARSVSSVELTRMYLARLERYGPVYNAVVTLLPKLAMVELAGGFGYGDADASFTGPGRTPWNANYWSGGSSSGSGIANPT